MKNRILVQRSEEGRGNFAKLVSYILMIVILAAIGLTSLIDDVESSVTCNGANSCMIVTFGSIGIVLLGMLLVWFIIYLLSYFACEWKEVTEDKVKKKKSKK